jgi:hypothetical protein
MEPEQDQRPLRGMLGEVARRGGLKGLALVFFASACGLILHYLPNSRLSEYIRVRFNAPDDAERQFR